MKITISVKGGIHKITCDDSAAVDNIICNDNKCSVDKKDCHFVGVADGVGGNAGGKEASLYLLEQICESAYNVDTIDDLRYLFEEMNGKLLKYADSLKDKKEMATTLTGLLFTKDTIYLIQSGNTRLYSLQGRYLKQMTVDQTTYQRLISRGDFEAAECCNKNEIYGCFGGGDEKFVKSLRIESIFQDSFPRVALITSDGVHEYVSIDDMEDIINAEIEDTEIAESLVCLAEKNGSPDDKTIVIIRKDC